MTKTIPGLTEEQTKDFLTAFSVMRDAWAGNSYLMPTLRENFEVDDSGVLLAVTDDHQENLYAVLSDVVSTANLTAGSLVEKYEKDGYTLNIWETSEKSDVDWEEDTESIFFELIKPDQAYPITFEFSYGYSSWSGPEFAEASICPVMKTPDDTYVGGSYSEEAMQAQIDIMEKMLEDYRALKETYFGTK